LQLGRASAGNASSPVRKLVIENPYALQGSWFKGNLHVASVRGVGRELPRTIGELYATRGYGFLGISDMNTYTWISEYGSSRLAGVPVVDASYPFADLLAVGDDQWLPAASLQQAIEGVANDAALPVLALSQSRAKGLTDDSVLKLHGLFGLEIYDARLAASGQPETVSLWDRLLSSGQRVFAFAGDDATSLSDPATGRAWIEILSPAQDLDSLLSSLRAGAFVASTGPGFKSIAVSGSTISVEAEPGASLRFVGKNGRLLKEIAGPSGSYRVDGSEKYVRIEAVSQDGSRAWSQPLFLSWR
jgi:hypothetical protein